MKRLINIAALLVLLFMAGSCIYDYPVNIPAGVTLDLHFKMERPATSDNPHLDETDVTSESHDIRYVIQAFRLLKNGEFSREPAAEFIFSKNDISSLDNTVSIEIEEGTYRFYAWADYVPQDSTEDYHFNTTDFNDLCLNCETYHGNTDSKEAYVGSDVVEVIRYPEDVPVLYDTISLKHSLAKYNIVSNDLQKFIRKMKARKAAETKAGSDSETEINLNDYLILVVYDQGLCYTSIDLHNDNMPIDGKFGLSYWSKIKPISENEALLGFDHIFIKPDQGKVNASVYVYDKDTTLITIAPVEIPVAKDSIHTLSNEILTYVKLTGDEMNGDGGVSIDPNFEGDINIKI